MSDDPMHVHGTELDLPGHRAVDPSLVAALPWFAPAIEVRHSRDLGASIAARLDGIRDRLLRDRGYAPPLVVASAVDAAPGTWRLLVHGEPVVDAAGADAVEPAIRRELWRALTIQDTAELVRVARLDSEEVVSRLGRAAVVELVADVLRELLRDDVSIAPITAVLEAIVSVERDGTPEEACGIDHAVDAVRRARQRSIVEPLAVDGVLRVLECNRHAAEACVRTPASSGGAAGERRRRLAARLARDVRATDSSVVVVPDGLRGPVARVLRTRDPDVRVLGADECRALPGIGLEVVGTVGAGVWLAPDPDAPSHRRGDHRRGWVQEVEVIEVEDWNW